MPQPRSFHSDSSSNAPALPAGGITLAQSRGSETWRGEGVAVRLAIDTPDSVLSNRTQGELLAGDNPWPVTLERDGEALSLSVSRSTGEIVLRGAVPFSSFRSANLNLSGSPVEIKAWHARQAVWLDGKPIAIWWDAWRDEDVERNILRFLWIDTSNQPKDWPVLVAIASLSARVSDATAFLMTPTF